MSLLPRPPIAIEKNLPFAVATIDRSLQRFDRNSFIFRLVADKEHCHLRRSLAGS